MMEAQRAKANNLCVETKGVCFFCLQVQVQEYQPSHFETNDHGARTDSHNKISLKRLSKYLSIDILKMFKLNIPLQYKNIKQSDVIVPLCGECAPVARKFAKLHFELELLKMQLDSCVCTIQEKLVKADNRQDLICRYRKRWNMTNPTDSIQAEIVDNLRKETKAKCQSKTGRLFPKVILEQLTNVNGSNRTPKPHPILTARNSQKRPYACGTQQEDTTKLFAKCPENENKVRSIPQQSPSPIRKSETNTPFGSTAVGIVAPKPPAKCTDSLSLHLKTSVSSQPLFVPMQPLLKPTVVASPISTTRVLPHVKNVSKGTAPSSFPRVQTIIGDPSEKGDLPSNKDKDKPLQSRGLYDCVHCEETFSDKSTLRIHVVRSHCEQFFTTLKDRSLSSEEFKSIVYLLFKDIAKSHTINSSSSNSSKTAFSCPHCQINHDTDGDVYAHMFRFHYTHLTSRLLTLQKERIIQLGEVTTTRREQPAKNVGPAPIHLSSPKFPCTSCTMNYASKRTLAFHQKYNCKYKLTSIQPTSAVVTNRTDEVFPSNSSVSTNSQTTKSLTLINPTTSRVVNQLNCSYCHKSFPFYYDLRVHSLSSHRLEEFSKYVSNGVTRQQIDAQLKYILQTYRKLPENDDAGGCTYCSEIFSSVAELQTHILVGHFDVLVFKLRGIMPLPQNPLQMQPNYGINDSNNYASVPDQIVDMSMITNSVGNVTLPVKEDNVVDANCDTLQVIMQDPLSLDLIEFNKQDQELDGTVWQEEEQLKMEWLFSFIDEDEGMGAPSQQSIDDDKGFVLGRNETELILP